MHSEKELEIGCFSRVWGDLDVGIQTPNDVWSLPKTLQIPENLKLFKLFQNIGGFKLPNNSKRNFKCAPNPLKSSQMNSKHHFTCVWSSFGPVFGVHLALDFVICKNDVLSIANFRFIKPQHHIYFQVLSFRKHYNPKAPRQTSRLIL